MRRYRSLMADNARWEGFKFRDGDIVISTPPKCGTTWMQTICALLVFQDPDLPAPLAQLSPWVDMQTARIDDVIATFEAQRHRRIIKSHTPLDGLPQDERVTYITVGRDPRDAGVSWDNHFENLNLGAVIGARAAAVGLDDLGELMPDGPPDHPEDPVARFWAWVEDDTSLEAAHSGLPGLVHHLDTFWRRRDEPNILLFHYADLLEDLDGEMRRLAASLGITVDDGRWPALVEAATFDHMRGNHRRFAPQMDVEGFWNDSAQFFRQGSSGQWRSFMNEADENRYWARISGMAPDDLIAWVHAGWRGLPTG